MKRKQQPWRNRDMKTRSIESTKRPSVNVMSRRLRLKDRGLKLRLRQRERELKLKLRLQRKSMRRKRLTEERKSKKERQHVKRRHSTEKPRQDRLQWQLPQMLIITKRR